MICHECAERPGEYEDPRTPPLEEGNCLCRVCRIGALDDCIEIARDEWQTLCDQREQATIDGRRRYEAALQEICTLSALARSANEKRIHYIAQKAYNGELP